MAKYRDKQLVERFSQVVNDGYEMSDKLRHTLRAAVVSHTVNLMSDQDKALFKSYLSLAFIK